MKITALICLLAVFSNLVAFAEDRPPPILRPRPVPTLPPADTRPPPPPVNPRPTPNPPPPPVNPRPTPNPQPTPRPRPKRKVPVLNNSPTARAIRGNPRGVGPSLGEQSPQGQFKGVLFDFINLVPFDFVDIKPVMHQETSPDELGFTIPRDEVVDSYILRNCATPIAPFLLDNHGAPGWDSLKAPADEPQPNQLRFMITVPNSMLNKALRLELVNPNVTVEKPRVVPIYHGPNPGLPQHPGSALWNPLLANLAPDKPYTSPSFHFFPIEIFGAWDLTPTWEQISPSHSQAMVVVNTGYIAGFKKDGNDVPYTLYARVVPQDQKDNSVISTKATIKIVHQDYCIDEHQAYLAAQAMIAAHKAEVEAQTIANRYNAPYLAEVVGYEPPAILQPIAGCDDGRFVHTKLSCAKHFPPYQGKGEDFWSSMGEMLSTLSADFDLLKHFVANLAIKLVEIYTPLGWTCEGLDYVAGTKCVDKLEKYGDQVAYMAINAGLVYAGIPPSIPDPQALINNGADYIAAEGVDLAAEQMGVELPPEMQQKLVDATSDQIKANASNMELQLRLGTIANSNHAKGPWYPEPLCEEQRLAGSFSGWTTPKATVYIRVTKKASFVGSDKNWKIHLYSGASDGAPTWTNALVKIPNSWPTGKISIIIPVSVEANYDYYEQAQDQFGSQAQARWSQWAWNSGKAQSMFTMDVYNSDLHGSSTDDCKNTLGIGCAPYPMKSIKYAVGQTWGMGSPPRLTRECNAAELLQLQNEPWPY